MSTQEPFTIEQFYKFLAAGQADGWQMPEMRKNPPATHAHSATTATPKAFEWVKFQARANCSPTQSSMLPPSSSKR